MLLGSLVVIHPTALRRFPLDIDTVCAPALVGRVLYIDIRRTADSARYGGGN